MPKTKKLTKNEEEAELRKNPINIFTCHACNSVETAGLSFEDFKKHVLDVHKIDLKGMKGQRQMMMHMDGDFWFSSQYAWTLESGLKFTQFCKNARAKDDPMRFGE